MSNFEWSTRSKAVLETLHPDLQKIANLAIQRTTVDIVLVEGARTIASQRAYYRDA